MEGSSQVVQHAVDIICHAIQLYKDLAEGNHCGMTVKRLHKLDKVIFRYEPPPRSKVPFAAQVEYEAAELNVLQTTRGSKSMYGIREVRDQLARRDEALMRANLPAPARQPRYQQRRGRRSMSATPIELGEAGVQDHDAPRRQLFEDFDSILSISTRSTKAKATHLSLRAQQRVRASSEKIPTPRDARSGEGDDGGEGRSDLVAKVSFSEGLEARPLYPDRPSAKNKTWGGNRGDGSSSGGPSLGGRGWSNSTWNSGGLYGIDSVFGKRTP